MNEDIVCDPIDDISYYSITNGAFGGRINDDFVFCGGTWGAYETSTTNLKHCYIMGQYYSNGSNEELDFIQNLTLTWPRFTYNGGVILPNNTIFVTGNHSNYSCPGPMSKIRSDSRVKARGFISKIRVRGIVLVLTIKLDLNLDIGLGTSIS